MKASTNKYFVCQDSVIYTIFPNGESNYGGHFKVIGETVELLSEDFCDTDGREVLFEATIHQSLMELVLIIEETTAI